MTRSKRTRRLPVLALATLAAAAAFFRPAASSASDVGLRVGYYFDAQALSMGMELLSPFDDHNAWFFNPNVELAVGDERNVAAFNGDFHYDFETSSDTAVWVGAGPALLITDHERRGADTDLDPALNLLFGLGAKTGTYRPFAQVKGIVSDHSDVALSVGIRF